MNLKEIAKIEARCVLKNESDLIKECDKYGIPRDWYDFNGNNKAPVYLIGNSVYGYGGGPSNCSVQMVVYDIMFKKLLLYKKYHDWLISNSKLRVYKIEIKTNDVVYGTQDLVFPNVYISKTTPEVEVNENLVLEGWEPIGFNHYNWEFRYKKIADIRTCIDGIYIYFDKKTDQRDLDTFCFKDEVTCGGFYYEVDHHDKDLIGKALWDKLNNKRHNENPITDDLKQYLIEKYAQNIIDDEYYQLVTFSENHRKALLNSIDKTLSEKEQRDRLAFASRSIKNQAAIISYGSRAHMIEYRNFNEAFKICGFDQ